MGTHPIFESDFDCLTDIADRNKTVKMADGFDSVKIIDGQGHLMGRLAATVAKCLLNGQRCVIVRCEGLLISGNFYRNKLKVLEYLRKRHLTKPSRGPFHGRSPSKMFKHVIRGMLPHKTSRGQTAFNSLKAFEGIPAPYDKCKRMIIPSAFKEIKIKPNRKFASVGRLAAETGWKYQGVISTLEARRQARQRSTGNTNKRRASSSSRPRLAWRRKRRKLTLPSPLTATEFVTTVTP